jgi:hypothetical protein
MKNSKYPFEKPVISKYPFDKNTAKKRPWKKKKKQIYLNVLVLTSITKGVLLMSQPLGAC